MMIPPRFEDIKAWAGECPIIRIGDEYYSIRERVGSKWLCYKVAYDPDTRFWYHADDEEYYFDKDGNIV